MSPGGITRWWWLRHAPVPDPEGRISGRLDLPCDTSDDDWFAILANQIPRNAVLVESGLIRCAQTVGALEAAGLILPPPIVETDLVEQDFGRWQGRTWEGLATVEDPDLADFWKSPATATPPGGESFAGMVERVRDVVERLSQEFIDRDILAVAHAGTIRAALAIALDISPEAALSFVITPLSLTRVDALASGGSRVVGVNWLPTW